MTIETGQQTSNGAGAPPPDPDAAKYEALRKELGIEPEGAAEEPEQKPEAEPEAQSEPEAEAQPEPQPVPRAEHENLSKALAAERDARKAAEAREAAIIKLIQENRTQREPEAKKEEAKLPDKQEDPIGYFEGRIAQLETALQQAQRGTQQTAEQVQAAQQKQYMDSAVIHSETEIRNPQSQAHKPDYDDAISYIRTTRAAELNMMFPDESPIAQQVAAQAGFRSVAEFKQATFDQDANAVTWQALQLGIPPAVYYYQLAVSRGYQPKAKTAAPAVVDKGKQQIEGLKRGKAASVSISGGNSGRKGSDDMSISDLSQLFIDDPDAADKVWEEMRKAGRLG